MRSHAHHIVRMIAVGIMLSSWPLSAQETIPALTLDANSLRQGPAGFIQEERPTFNYENPYLNETLILQYQNILLEKMIQRQSALARTEKSFMDVGVPFNAPAPPRGICEQLPANVPCYRVYPELYGGPTATVSQIDETPIPPPVSQKVASSPPPAKEQKEFSAAPPTDVTAYRWAEITCAGGRCTAVVVHNGARRSVRTGDLLEEGIRVERITATGVDVAAGGRTESLPAAAAPSRGGAASPKYAGGVGGRPNLELTGSLEDRSRQLEDHFKGEPSSTAAPQTDTPPPAGPAAAASSAPADYGPPLGATGLF